MNLGVTLAFAIQLILHCSIRAPVGAFDAIPAPTVTNARNNASFESGFLIGTAIDEGNVEIAFDSGNFSAATRTATKWKMAIPRGSATWREGTLHTARLRTVINGNYSEILQIRLLKGKNKDINGDGYNDIAIGAPNGSGKFLVWHSAGETGIASANETAANTAVTGTGAGSSFGQFIASGDINGDGYADLLVGAQTANSNFGKAFVFLSQGSNGIASGTDTSASATISGTTNSTCGAAVFLADVNGDGFDDAIIGAAGASGNLGKVYIFSSSGAAGISTANDTAATATLSGTFATGQFGNNLVAKDINGDGYADLIVAADQASGGNGRVYIFYSAGTSGLTSLNDTSASTTLVGTNPAAVFGGGVVAGDLNGDGYNDIVIAAPSSAASAGKVYVFYSQGVSGVSSGSDTSASAVLSGTVTNGFFGRFMSIGDINGDTYPDLLVGANYAVAATIIGNAFIFHSRGATGIGTANDTSAATILTGTINPSRFGNGVSISDVNGDGFGDALVGAPFVNSNNGRLYIFSSSGSKGIQNQNDISAGSILTGTTTGGWFGYWPN